VLFIAGVALLAADDGAQRGSRDDFFFNAPRVVPAGSYDGSFRFCRISFRNSPQGDGDGLPLTAVRLGVRTSTGAVPNRGRANRRCRPAESGSYFGYVKACPKSSIKY